MYLASGETTRLWQSPKHRPVHSQISTDLHPHTLASDILAMAAANCGISCQTRMSQADVPIHLHAYDNMCSHALCTTYTNASHSA